MGVSSVFLHNGPPVQINSHLRALMVGITPGYIVTGRKTITMKTVLITLGSMLLCILLQAQEKPASHIEGLSLFTLQINNKLRTFQKDTIAAEITVVHKIGNNHPAQTFIGWVVQTGKGKRFFSESWDPMPAYLAVQGVKELPPPSF